MKLLVNIGYSLSLAFLCLIYLQAPALAQSAYTMFPSMYVFRIAAEWTNILYFYLAVVYFFAGLCLACVKQFKSCILDLGIACLSIVFMVFEPSVLTMMIFSGYQYTVKITILVAFISVFCLVSLGFLLLPAIMAFSARYKNRLLIVFLNIAGVVVPPLLVVAIFKAQNRRSKEVMHATVEKQA